MATATEEKDKGGRPVNKPTVSRDEVIELGINPPSREQLAKKTGIGHDAARTIKKVMDMTVEEFQDAQRAKLQRVADLALSQAEKALPKASALQAATAYGIFSDKLNKPVANQTLHIHLAPGDRSGAISALLGKHGERVSSADSIPTKAVKIAEPVPAVDLDTVEPGPILHTGDSQSPTKLPK